MHAMAAFLRAAALVLATKVTASEGDKTAACMLQRRFTSGKQRAIRDSDAPVSEIIRGIYDDDAIPQWAGLQQAFVDELTAGATEQERAPLRVLVVTYLGNSQELVDIWGENVLKLSGNGAGDLIDFAFFHYDGNNSLFRAKSWYHLPAVRLKHLGMGCAPQFLQMLNASFVQPYDYIWLMDGDMSLRLFSWDVYRGIIVKLAPIVSQPAILPRAPFARASDLKELNMRWFLEGDAPVLARESTRTEVMTPMLSRRVWSALLERLTGNDLHDMFWTDDFWDFVGLAPKAGCGGTGIVIVDAAPSVHLDLHAIASTSSASAHCTSGGSTPWGPNNRPLDRRTLETAAAGLLGHCDHAGAVLLPYEGKPVIDSHYQLLREAPFLRSWTAGALAAGPRGAGAPAGPTGAAAERHGGGDAERPMDGGAREVRQRGCKAARQSGRAV
eukprot:CAMPEP_0204600780 /NCGR_PEP_ID=MMETSP0661-20131031/55645_1 /ASSEMBLY_ACC=CAM_ASM_000606 /TAXON_ID=109239 /ORGANISM="Alexandrium margalefi, Strain AMGDE01CS-322" /LENGTH=441 /DNA_ID=CAMNT_0051611615 /DNA_START=36 /DNA_END=1359 /DNA_ORIENTATION=+